MGRPSMPSCAKASEASGLATDDFYSGASDNSTDNRE